MKPVTLRIGDRALSARTDAEGRVHIAEDRFTVTAAAPGVYVVDDGTRRWQVAVAAAGDKRWVSVDGQVAVLEVEPVGGTQRRRKSGGAESMTAPMPATVLEVLVEPGQAVREGDTVLVLEAMKMELSIRAPRDGTVSAVRCTQGELVQPGVPLVELG